jgi:hypothetical protein
MVSRSERSPWPTSYPDPPAIVDAEYDERIERRIVDWECRRRVWEVEGLAAKRFQSRQQDRFFNCCRVDDLPAHLCTHHRDVMKEVAGMKHSGPERILKAFVFRDWWAVRARYEFDLRELCDGVSSGALIEPGDKPLPRLRSPRPDSSPGGTRRRGNDQTRSPAPRRGSGDPPRPPSREKRHRGGLADPDQMA